MRPVLYAFLFAALAVQAHPGRVTGTIEGAPPGGAADLKVMLWSTDVVKESWARIEAVSPDPHGRLAAPSASRVDVRQGATSSVKLTPQRWQD